MYNIDSGVTVSNRQTSGAGYKWDVTFPASMGNVPAITAYMSDVPIAITTEKEVRMSWELKRYSHTNPTLFFAHPLITG